MAQGSTRNPNDMPRASATIHRKRGTHGITVTDTWRGGRHRFDEFARNFPASLAAFPHHRAGTGPFAFVPAIEHRAATQDNRRNIHCRRGHQTGRRGLIAAGSQDHAIKGVTMQNFNQTEIRQIPIQCRRRSSATSGSDARTRSNSTGIAHAFLGAFHCFQMPPVTRRQITADLSNPDYRPSGLQFLPRQSIVQIPST